MQVVHEKQVDEDRQGLDSSGVRWMQDVTWKGKFCFGTTLNFPKPLLSPQFLTRNPKDVGFGCSDVPSEYGHFGGSTLNLVVYMISCTPNETLDEQIQNIPRGKG